MLQVKRHSQLYVEWKLICGVQWLNLDWTACTKLQNAVDLKEIANEFTARNERNRCVWEVLISHGVLRVQFKYCVRITYSKIKLVVFLVFTFIYFLCPTSKSLRNLLVKLTFCRKPKYSQYAIKSLLETVNPIFFLGKIPKHPHTRSLSLYMAGPLFKSRRWLCRESSLVPWTEHNILTK